MSIEKILEIASCLTALGLLYYYVPKSKHREAVLSVLFMQSLTWLLGGLVVELKLISYPVRLFKYAFQTSFTFEFIVFPAVSVVFNLYFPKNGTCLKKLVYSVAFPTLITIGEVLLEKHTKTIEYIQWNWFLSWSSMWVTLLFSYVFYRWFFKKYKTSKYRPSNLYL